MVRLTTRTNGLIMIIYHSHSTCMASELSAVQKASQGIYHVWVPSQDLSNLIFHYKGFFRVLLCSHHCGECDHFYH